MAINRPTLFPLEQTVTLVNRKKYSLKRCILKKESLHFESVSDFMIWITLPSIYCMFDKFVVSPQVQSSRIAVWVTLAYTITVFYQLSLNSVLSENYTLFFAIQQFLC